MAPFEASNLTLDAVLGDLQTIATIVIAEQEGGTASYENVQQSLGDLAMHALTYIRFLENHGFVSYDRTSDRITITPLGRAAAQDGAVWREQAAIEFIDAPIDYGTDFTEASPLGSLSEDVDDILDSIADLDVDSALSEVSNASTSKTSELDAGRRSGNPFSMPPGVQSDERSADPTKPEMATPARDATPEPSKTSKNMSNDSFSSRRLSSQSPAATRSAPASGAKLYERAEPIGTGGMGTVFKATQIKLNRSVAVKEIKEIFDVFAGVQRSDIVDRFTTVVQTQSNLLHPNIIQVVDLDTEAQFPFVVMQYAPNGNLRRLIESEGRPPLQIALKYFLQILHALNTAHDHGVTHGGIKPENVVLDHAGNALVTDFGISRIAELDANNGANQVYVGVGTVAYMSPEQFRDPNISSVKSDIYSLGIMFYEMLTGKVPGRRSPMPSSFFPDIPRALDDVFDRMSMDDINERFETIEEVLSEVYGSEEVMAIIDKRGGFLFLRDPITHGETGGVALFDDESPAVARPPAEDDDDDGDGDLDLPAADGDVLDKLDKYSGMFDDDGDEDSEGDDSDASDDSEGSEDSDADETSDGDD